METILRRPIDQYTDTDNLGLTMEGKYDHTVSMDLTQTPGKCRSIETKRKKQRLVQDRYTQRTQCKSSYVVNSDHQRSELIRVLG